MSTATLTQEVSASQGRRRSTVAAGDGTGLRVAEFGPAAAPVTVIFTHGLGLHMGVWAPQRVRLQHLWGERARLVFFDHRGHGASDPASPESCTVEQLGSDLAAVIAAVAPTGPIVLVGHSLGGMAILKFIAAHPTLVAERVAGVALLATAADRVPAAGVARLLGTPAAALLRAVATRAPGVIDFGWRCSRRLAAPLVGKPWPGMSDAATAVLAAGKMVHRTPIVSLAGFLADLRRYDASAALPILADTPVVVMCGDADAVLPLQHSMRIAAELPNAELVIVAHGRHMIGLDSVAVVNTQLDRLLQRAVPTTEHTVPDHGPRSAA